MLRVNVEIVLHDAVIDELVARVLECPYSASSAEYFLRIAASAFKSPVSRCVRSNAGYPSMSSA
jgi:hypothetical protein